MIDFYKCAQKLNELEENNEKVCELIAEMRAYIKEQGALTKYQQPEKFATTCLSYCDKVEALLSRYTGGISNEQSKEM